MASYSLEEVFVPVGFPQNTYIVREQLEKGVKLTKLNKGKHLLILGLQRAERVIYGGGTLAAMKSLRFPSMGLKTSTLSTPKY